MIIAVLALAASIISPALSASIQYRPGNQLVEFKGRAFPEKDPDAGHNEPVVTVPLPRRPARPNINIPSSRHPNRQGIDVRLDYSGQPSTSTVPHSTVSNSPAGRPPGLSPEDPPEDPPGHSPGPPLGPPPAPGPSPGPTSTQNPDSGDFTHSKGCSRWRDGECVVG
jgi:hypothetical protein